MFCACRILPKGLKFVENFPRQGACMCVCVCVGRSTSFSKVTAHPSQKSPATTFTTCRGKFSTNLRRVCFEKDVLWERCALRSICSECSSEVTFEKDVLRCIPTFLLEYMHILIQNFSKVSSIANLHSEYSSEVTSEIFPSMSCMRGMHESLWGCDALAPKWQCVTSWCQFKSDITSPT